MSQSLAPATAHSLEAAPGAGGWDNEVPVTSRGSPQLQSILGLDEVTTSSGDLVTLPLVPATQLLRVIICYM